MVTRNPNLDRGIFAPLAKDRPTPSGPIKGATVGVQSDPVVVPPPVVPPVVTPDPSPAGGLTPEMISRSRLR